MLTKSSLNKFKKKEKKNNRKKNSQKQKDKTKKKPVKLFPRITCTAANFIQMMHFCSQPPS